MAEDSSSSATGGLLVVLGIIVALVVGFIMYKQGFLDSRPSGPSITVEVPAN